MKVLKNIIKSVVIGAIIVSFFVISTPESQSSVISIGEKQEPHGTKASDSLQGVLNNYNKIALFNDSLIEKKVKTIDLLEAKQSELKAINLKSELLNQELHCEKIDSCRKILVRKIEVLKNQKGELTQAIATLNDRLEIEKKVSAKKSNEQEEYLLKVQQFASEISGSRKIKYKGNWYYLFVVNTDSCQILMHHKDSLTKKPYNTINNVYKALVKSNLKPLMITNAGMYTASYEPQGLFIENYKELYPIDTTRPNDNNFYIKPNGVFYLDGANKPFINTTENFLSKYRSKSIKVKFATQSGPMLLINGKIHPVFTINSSNRKIRSGVGIINNKKVVFAISIDEANFYDFASLFKDLFKCKDALFLDGAISKMFLFDKAPQEKGGAFGPIISVVKSTK